MHSELHQEPIGSHKRRKFVDYKSDLSETFIIKNLHDHWEDYSYHQRYLDAMASIFAVQGAASAITYFPKTQKFYLSYNANPIPITLEKRDIIQKYLNIPSNPDQIKGLLFLYLAYNHDFKECLSKDYNIFNDTFVYELSIPTYQKEDTMVELEAASYDFSQRLDSFTVKRKKLASKENVINEILRDLRKIIKRIQDYKTIDPDIKFAGEEISDRDKNLIELYDKVIDSYMSLMETLSDKDILHSDKSKDFYRLARALLRPLQDVEKLSYYLKHKGIGGQSIEVEIIANNKLEMGKTKHAEANLGKEFASLKGLYIGVSKLCCGLCDYLLSNKYYHDHRGTHGTCDPKWGAPTIQDIDLREEIHGKSTGINQAGRSKQLSQQHRALSNDDLKALIPEPNLPDQDFLFQQYENTLLYGEVNDAI